MPRGQVPRPPGQDQRLAAARWAGQHQHVRHRQRCGGGLLRIKRDPGLMPGVPHRIAQAAPGLSSKGQHRRQGPPELVQVSLPGGPGFQSAEPRARFNVGEPKRARLLIR